MNLLEHLTHAEIQNLRNIAARVGHFQPESSKQRLVSAITRKLSNQESLAQILDDLSEHAYDTLRYLVNRPECNLTLSDNPENGNPSTGADSREAMNELALSGLVGTQSVYGRPMTLYQVFGELNVSLSALLKESTDGLFVSFPQPAKVYSYPNLWRDDLVSLLGYCHRNTVSFTKNRLPQKRDLAALEPLLRSTQVADLCRRFTSARFDGVHRLFRMLGLIGVVEFRGERIIPKESAFDQIQKIIEVFEGDPLHFFHPEHDGGLISDDYRVIEKYIGAARDQGSTWMSVDALCAALLPPGFDRESPDTPNPVREALFDLMAVGLCEIGETDGDWYWNPRSRDEETPYQDYPLHIQANFELIGPGNLPIAERCSLEQIAELVSVDQLFHYKISRDSIYTACGHGWTSESMLTHIQDRIGETKEIPQNVRHSIESWGQAYGRTSLEAPLLLICESADLAEDLLHTAELSPYCRGLFSEKALLIEKGAEDSVFAVLKRLGHLPLPEVGDGSRWVVRDTP